ncbi:MAG: hypothetical protein ACP5O3_02145 [Candidatus Micrarchaeia archaeon]
MVFASEKEVSELKKYLSGSWEKERLPSLLERWEIDLDEGAEDVEFTKPVIDLKKLKAALDKMREAQALDDVVKGLANQRLAYEPVVLVFFKGLKGQYPRGACGIANEQSIEISTIAPPALRRKVFKMLPEFLKRR